MVKFSGPRGLIDHLARFGRNTAAVFGEHPIADTRFVLLRSNVLFGQVLLNGLLLVVEQLGPRITKICLVALASRQYAND